MVVCGRPNTYVQEWAIILTNAAAMLLGGILAGMGFVLLLSTMPRSIALVAGSTPGLPPPTWSATLLLLTILGAIVCLLALPGVLRPVWPTPCISSMAYSCLIICVLTEFVCGFLALATDNYAESIKLESAMLQQAQSYYGRPGYDQITHAWDILQTTEHCCGTSGFSDYDDNVYTNLSIAWSCCVMKNHTISSPENILNAVQCYTDATNNLTTSPFYYQQGCLDAERRLMSLCAVIVIFVCYSAFLLHMIHGLVFRVYETVQKRREYKASQTDSLATPSTSL